MNLTRIKPMRITGLSVRTNNADERTEASRIGPLWQRFGESIGPQLQNGSQVYGVYCHYSSDHLGDFDVIAGTDQSGLKAPENLTSVQLADTPYLVFKARGQLPQAVIDTWQSIWAYFDQTDCPFERAFTTDYEHYVSDEAADIYIAVS